MSRFASKRRRPWLRALLAGTSLLLLLGLAEAGLRLFYPRERWLDLSLLHEFVQSAAMAKDFITADRELGHVPVLGGRSYDELGCLRGPIAGAGDGPTVLFLGDSVTHRGRLLAAIAQQHPGPAYKNAGVEAWNPMQEVQSYLRATHRVRPAHVVLTFHNNDFSVTPVGLQTEDGFAVCMPGVHSAFDPDLYERCFLYRLLVRARNGREWGQGGYFGMAEAVERSVQQLRDRLRQDGIALTVLLLPMTAPWSQWLPHELESRQRAIALFERLSLHWIDLLEPNRQVEGTGVAISERPGDRWHPNDLVCAAMAAFALQQGLFADPPVHVRSDRAARTAGSVQAQQWLLDFGAGFAHCAYRVLGSRSGCHPGVRFGRQRVLLMPDAYTVQTFAQPDSVMTGGTGQLDAAGRATVAIRGPDLADGALPVMLCHACVVLAADGSIGAVSAPVPLLLAPRRP